MKKAISLLKNICLDKKAAALPSCTMMTALLQRQFFKHTFAVLYVLLLFFVFSSMSAAAGNGWTDAYKNSSFESVPETQMPFISSNRSDIVKNQYSFNGYFFTGDGSCSLFIAAYSFFEKSRSILSFRRMNRFAKFSTSSFS